MNELRQHAPPLLLVVAGMLLASAYLWASAEIRNVALVLGLICTGAGVFIYVRAEQVAEMTDAADGGTHRAWIGHIFIVGGSVFGIVNAYGVVTGTREKPIEGFLVAVVFALIGVAMVLMRRGEPPRL
jgi:FtsH-binding integral membrane protein